MLVKVLPHTQRHTPHTHRHTPHKQTNSPCTADTRCQRIAKYADVSLPYVRLILNNRRLLSPLHQHVPHPLHAPLLLTLVCHYVCVCVYPAEAATNCKTRLKILPNNKNKKKNKSSVGQQCCWLWKVSLSHCHLQADKALTQSGLMLQSLTRDNTQSPVPPLKPQLAQFIFEVMQWGSWQTSQGFSIHKTNN